MLRSGFLALGLCGAVCADSGGLDPILITASRVAESTEETLYSVSVVEREEIEQLQARDVSEVLRRLPGIQVGRNGGPGQATSLFIRGAASDHTLLLLDGVPVNSGTVGSAAFQHLVPEQIERIEVVRGPTSTLYGSSAIGGVVQLFTRRASAAREAGLAFAVGSEGSDRVTASAGHAGEGLHARVAAHRSTSDGYPIRPSLSPLDRGYDNETVSGVVGTTVGGLDVEASYLRAEGLVEYVDFFGSAVDQDTVNTLARVAAEARPDDRWHTRLLLAQTTDQIDENQSDDFADTRRDYADWQNTIALDARNTLVAGLTGSWTDTRLRSFGSGYDEDIRSLEAYLQDTIELDATRVQLGGRAIDNEKYGSHYTWKAAVGHALNDATRIHANAGTAFRAPSANDLYGFGGNPDFEPETSIGGELGARYRVNAADSVRAVAFYTEIDDLIETDPITFTVEQIEKARIRGVELGYRHTTTEWLWSLDYTYQDPRNVDLDQQLPRRARNKVDGVLRYRQPRWWGAATLRYESDRPDSRFTDAVMDAYLTIGVDAGYRLGDGFTLSARIDNLFDEDYELAAGYPAQGRFIGVEIRYDHAGE